MGYSQVVLEIIFQLYINDQLKILKLQSDSQLFENLFDPEERKKMVLKISFFEWLKKIYVYLEYTKNFSEHDVDKKKGEGESYRKKKKKAWI